MIAKLFNHPHVLYQTASDEGDYPNEAIAAHIDNGGTICLEQAGHSIVLNRGSIPELCNLLKKLSKVEAK